MEPIVISVNGNSIFEAMSLIRFGTTENWNVYKLFTLAGIVTNATNFIEDVSSFCDSNQFD